MMYQRVKKQFVMSDLIRKYSKLNLSQPGYDFLLDSRGALVVGSAEKLSKVVVEDIVKVDHRQFVPWVMSNYVNIDQKVGVFSFIIIVSYVRIFYHIIGALPWSIGHQILPLPRHAACRSAGASRVQLRGAHE
jgi:hypothetical protein